MGNNDGSKEFEIILSALLNQAKSKKQINKDIKSLENVVNALRLTATFAKGATKKELNAYIRQLGDQLSRIKLKAKFDERAFKREVDQALNNMSFKEIDLLNINENKFKLKARKVIADTKTFVNKNPIYVNLELKKKKLNNQLTTYLTKNSKIRESEALLKEADEIREKISAINDKSSLKNATESFQLFKSEVQAVGYQTKSTTDKVKNMVSGITKIGSMFGVASIAINNFVKSLQTLKGNDTILTEISKTSEMTKQQLVELGNEAFKTASQFGQLSSNYLVAVQEMARSGYEDTSKELGKLSLLAQSAGDMTAENANDFLLATDAAYEYSGSVEKLNAALDGANFISNKNSASLTDIADGIRVSASYAANAGIAIDELTAAEGTMIATTKRSGSEMGRAFRSIILNLQQVSGEFDGEVIDEEQLKKVEARCHSLGVELEYLKDGVATLRNPMEILKDLAEVYNSLPDNSADKQGLISDLGGKYHANALSSLLSRWDLYEKMLVDYSKGTGSALEEAKKTADSWEGRINSMQNSWDSFINSLTNKNVIKSGISFFDNSIQAAETLVDVLGEIPVLLTTINTAMVAMNKDYGLTQVINPDTKKVDLQGNLFGIDFTQIKQQKAHFEEAGDAIAQYNDKIVNGAVDLDSFNSKVVKNNAQLKEYLKTCSADAPASLEGYKAYLNAAGVSTDALRLKTVLLNSAISLGIGVAFQGVTWLISKGIENFEDYANAEEKAAEAMEKISQKATEAKNNISQLQTKISSNKGKVDEIAEEYAKLAQGVDLLDNSNRLLSTDNYSRFLELSNELSELFPSLTKGYDDNGNAILDLSGNVDTITSSLYSLLNVQEQLAKQEIIDNLSDIWDGYVVDKKNATYDKNSANISLSSYNKALQDVIEGRIVDTQNIWANDIAALDTVLSNSGLNIEEYKKKKWNFDISRGLLDSVYSTYTYDLSELTDTQKQLVNTAYNELISEYQNNAKNAENEIENANSQLQPYLFTWLTNEYTYKKINGNNSDLALAIQQIINDSLNNIPSDIQTWDEASNWLEENILFAINNIDDSEISQALADLYTKNMSSAEMLVQIDKIQNYFGENNPISIALQAKVDIVKPLVDGAYDRILPDSTNLSAGISNTLIDALSQVDKNIVTNWIKSLDNKELELVNTDEFEQALEKQKEKLNGATLSANDYETALQTVKDAQNNLEESTPLSFSEAFNASDFSDAKEKLLDLAKSGEITTSVLKSTEEYKTLLDQTRLSADDVKDQILDMLSAQEKLSGATSGLEKLKSAYEEFKDEDIGFVTASTLESLPDAFKELEGFDLFSQIAGDPTSGKKKIQQAFNDIVTEYIKYQATLGQLNSRNSDIYIANLKNMGISNAKSVVNAALEIYKDVDDAMSEIENLTDEELQHYVDALNDKGVKTSDVYSQIGKASAKLYGDLGKQYQSDLNEYVKALNEKKRLYNQWVTAASKKNSTVGGSTYSSTEGYKSDAKRIAAIKAATNANIAQKQLEEDLKLIDVNFELDYQPKTTGSGNSSSGKSSSKTSSEASKTKIDWMERSVNVLTNKIDTLKAKLENVFTVKAKNSIIDKEISNTQKLIKVYEKQAKVYKKQAQASNALSKDLKSKIQNGQINGTRSQLIKTYGEKTANAIQEYQDYWDKYLESLKNVKNAKTDIRNLTIEKYQNKQDSADQKADYYSILSESATTSKKQNAYLDKQAKQLQESYKWQIKIANAEHDSIKAKQLQVDLQNQLVELQKQQIDNIHNETSNRISGRDLKSENSLSSTNIKNSYLKDADELIAESVSITSDASINKGTKNILSATYGKGTDWYKKNITQTLDSYSKRMPKGIATRIKNAIANGTAISDADLKAVKKIDSKLYSQLKSYNDAYQNTKKTVSDYANDQAQENIKEAREARVNAAQVDLDSSDLALDNLSSQYENATSASEKNAIIQKQIAETANNYDKRRNVLAAEYSDANGKIIQSEEYKNKLLAINAKQQKEILNLQIQSEQNLADEASARYDLNQQLAENATSSEDKNTYEKKSLSNIQSQYKHLIEIANISGDVTESERLRAELAQKTADSYLKQFQNLKDEYDFIISSTEHEISLINSVISQVQAKGLKNYGSYLRQGLSDAETEAVKQKEKLTALNEKLSNDIANGRIIVGSLQYQQAIQEVRAAEQAVFDADGAVIKWNNDIRDLEWDNFQWVREQVNYLADESQFLIDVLAHDKLTKSFNIDDTSLSSVLQSLEGVNDWTDILTDAGTATLSEYANIIDSKDRIAKDYYAKSEEYMKKFQETGDTVYLEMAQNAKNTAESATKDMLSAQDNIKSIVEQSLESLESAIDVIISKYEDALDAEKDVYDYQKTVEEKTKTLNSLRKQMIALSGNDTEENQATLQKLSDQIKNAQDDLNETEYDKYISDQKKLLSSFQDDVKDYISKYLDDTNSILSDIYEYISTDEAKESTENAEIDTLPYEQGFQEFNTTLGSSVEEVVESGNRLVESVDSLNDTISDTISKNEQIKKLGDELFETVSKSVSDTGSHDQRSISIYDILNGGNNGEKIDLTDTNALMDLYDKVSEYGDLLYGDKIYELLDELLMLQGVDIYHTSHANRGGYAKGTRNATKGLHLFDEDGLGSEAIITKDGVLKQFEGGEHVFNSEETEALHDLSELIVNGNGYLKPIHNNPLSNIDPQWQKLLESYNPMSNLVLPSVMPLPKIAERNNGGNITIDIGGMTVNGVNDPEELANGVINLLNNNPKVQKAVRRETIDKTLPGVRFR